MARWNSIARGAAATAAAALILTACSTEGGEGEGSDEPLIIGTLLPITGSLAFLGPPEIAGVDLAIKEINEAGGVLGADVTVIHTDSSDTANPQIATQSVTELVNAGVSAIIGAASSSVTFNVIDDITAAGIVQVSPANTATGLSGYSPYYFRTAPPDTVQGNALAQLMLDDGHSDIGILVFNDDYGTSLRDVIQDTVEGAGGSITYGTSGQEFDPNASNFATDVGSILETNPDAIALIAFDQTKQIIPEIVAAGFDVSKLYLVDGNTADYSADFPAGTLAGAKGTIPGANPTADFQALMNDVHGSTLDSFAYGAESYDATMLVALAAVRGGGTDAKTIRDNLAAVSGAVDGATECSSFAACVELLEADEEIFFQTVGGSGPFNDDNDPSSAFIGVYQFDGDNVPQWIAAVFGEV
ncbi:MAG: ABC transporter substrate-binding protein [Actinobacteria bacterium HGW-Actinobacteria-4]|nr:MAG: ABC transporter substrate-binding protein [Actinobacteria bacterium HGW-Actinobacteria-4]